MASTAPVAGPAWWKWMLVASFLLIVLAGAAWFVRPYLPQWAWDGSAGLPAQDRPAPGPTTTAAVDDSALRALKDREAQLAAALASLRDQFVDKRKACTPGATGRVVPDTTVPSTPPPDTQADGGIVVLPDGRRVRPDGVVVDGDGKPMLGPDGRPVVVDRDRMRTATAPTKPDAVRPDARPPAAAPRTDAPKADTTRPPAAKPDVAARPDTTRPPAGPARPPGTASTEKPIEPVKVPPGKGVDFMEGTWRSSTDLTTGGDDVVRPQYSFDKDGKGKTRIIQKNGVVCEGPASAQRDDQGRLVIRESEPLKCTDGTSYAPSTVTCQTDAAGRSTCSGSSEGGPGYVVTLGR